MSDCKQSAISASGFHPAKEPVSVKNKLAPAVLLGKILPLGLFFLMLSNPKLSASCAAAGLSAWYTSVVPVLLPAMIFTGILVRTDACTLLNPIAAPLFQKLFHLPAEAASAWLTGLLCGYPAGAAVAGELYHQERLTQEQIRHLLLFCNYPSPMFLTGFLLTGCLKGQVPVWLFLPVIYLSGCITGFLTRATAQNCQPPLTDRLSFEPSAPKKKGLIQVLEPSLFTAARIMLMVGLYIMLFQMIAGFALHYLQLPPLVLCILIGILEMTNGVLLAADLTLPLLPLSCLMLFFAVFGGISTYLQSLSALGDAAFLGRKYLLGRILHASLAVGLYLFFFLLLQML